MKTSIALFTSLFALTAFAGNYKIDTASSKIEWKAGKKIGKFHNGEIKIKGGSVTTDKKGTLKSAQIVVDMKTIADFDLKDTPEYQQKLVGHLSSDDFFKIEKFPESTFNLESITAKPGSKDEFIVKGKLTMIGNEQSIEFPAKMKVDKKEISGSATVTIERLKWGLQYGSENIFKSLAADKIINDTFELTINLVAKQAK